MDVSITGFSSSSPTYFSIQVILEGRVTYTVNRRYSEFATFAQDIEQEMGEPTPVALPSKKWIGNSNHEFLEERRRGLELFLRRLIKIEEWRDSLAVQQFLDVAKHRRQAADKLNYEPAAIWVKATSEVRLLLQQAKTSTSTESRRYVLTARNKIKELEGSLITDKSLGEGEYVRRRNVILELSQMLDKLENPSAGKFSSDSYANRNSTSFNGGEQRSQEQLSLFGNAPARTSRRVLGAGVETDRTRQFNNSGLVTLQKDDMQKQDQIIESLRKTIRTQREIGEQIHDELEYQNRLLDNLDQETHSTNAKLNQARRRVTKFT